MAKVTFNISSSKKGGFYGWMALAGVALVAFVVGGAFVYSYGVFLPIMSAEFGWSRAVVSAGYTIGMIVFGLSSPLIGVLITRFGARMNLVLGSLLCALGLAGMYLAQEVWHLYLLYGLAGLGASGGGALTCVAIANNWFVRKRSLAMGISTAATGLGGFALPPVGAALIAAVGWRMSWVVLAGMVLVFAVLLGGIVLVRNRPEDLGQEPDGLPVETGEGTMAVNSLSGIDGGQGGWRTGQALQSPILWCIIAFGAANYFVMGTMVTHQVAYLQDLGFSHIVGAVTMSLIPGVGIIGRLGFGVLALRFSLRSLLIFSFVVQLLALVILISTRDLALIYIYAALLGISTGAVMTALPTFTGAYYGRACFASIQGVVYALGISAFAVGPAFAGIIYDATGTYMPVFIVIIAVSLLGLICAFLARPPGLPVANS